MSDETKSRRLAEQALSSEDGWMWAETFKQKFGFKPTASVGFMGHRWESKMANGYTRHRMLSNEVRQVPGKCAGCEREITKNRTYVVSGVAICQPCQRRIFLDGDLVFARQIGVQV